MKISEAPRSDFKQFSGFSKAFTDQNEFESFLSKPLNSVNDLKSQAEQKLAVYPKESRRILQQVLCDQMLEFASESQRKNLGLLSDDNTVTITTGHQLTLFGGPLYLVYKVMHVVKLVEAFNAASVDQKAVPVFWMASEDHDFEEISSALLFNRELKWVTEQKGAVGRMHTTELKEVHTQLAELFTGKETVIQNLLSIPVDENYGTYFQRFLIALFADYGVLVLQPDSRALKELFIPAILSELEADKSLKAVEEMNASLESAGYSPQAMARNCNLFLLKDGARTRIDRIEKGFAVDGEVFSLEQLQEMARTAPESFSPNVILRPVYQETVLPNICYVGGGGEMAYWVQLKKVFETKNVLFPLIAQRNSVILIDGGTEKKLQAMNLSWLDFKDDKEQLKKNQLALLSGDDVNFEEISTALNSLKNAMVDKAAKTDKSLESFAEAEVVRLQKQIENFEQRIIKQVKQKNEVQLKQIDAIAEKLFPSGGLQERHFHWLHFAPSGNFDELFKAIYEGIEPFNSNFIAIRC